MGRLPKYNAKTPTNKASLFKIYLSISIGIKMSLKGIVHFEIKIWYVSAYPKGIQDVGVFFLQ